MNEGNHREQLLLGQLTGNKGPAPGVVRERRKPADRRRYSPWSFLYGGFHPRRRTRRRDAEDAHVFIDWHEPKLLYLVLSIMLMSCIDALLTLNLLAVGGAEVNLVMDFLLGRDVAEFLQVKLGLTAISVVLLAIAAHRHFLGRVQVLYILRLFCVGYAALIIYELHLIQRFLGDIFPNFWSGFMSITFG